MAPSRRKGAGKAAAAAAARRQWKVGDLVLAKVKGFPAWPAVVSEPEKWGYNADWKKVLVHFFGTQQIAFCNPADVEAFTEEKKQSLLMKRHAKGSDFVRAVKEIIESFEKLKQQELAIDQQPADEVSLGSGENPVEVSANITDPTQRKSESSQCRDESTILSEDASAAEQMLALRDNNQAHEQASDGAVVKEPRKIATYSSRKRTGGARSLKSTPSKKAVSVQHSKSASMLQGGDGVDDAGLRRKRMRTSPGLSESDDVALNSNGSDEENASEIATVESDGNTRNEGSSKKEHSNNGGQCRKGDHEINIGLDFQINTMVLRRKRKPARKRGANEPPAKVEVEVEADAGTGGCNGCETLQNSSQSLNERSAEEKGDEHLPLVKRARVRMSRTFYNDEEINVEERSSISPSSNHKDETCAAEVSHTCDALPSPEKKSADNMSPSKPCEQIGEDQQIPLISKSPDDEAAQTQSKQISISPDAEVVESCSRALQIMPLQITESDPPSVQSPHHNEPEAPLETDAVTSCADKSHGFCSGLDATVSGVPTAPSSDQHQNSSVDNIGVSMVDDAVLSEIEMVKKQDVENTPLIEEHESQSNEGNSGEQTITSQDLALSTNETEMIVEEAEAQSETGRENVVENIIQHENIDETEEERKEEIQTANSVSLSENFSCEKMSISPANIADSPARGTPHSNSVCHISTAESENVMQANGSCSPNPNPTPTPNPNGHFAEKKLLGASSAAEAEKTEIGVCEGHKVNVSDVLEAFESALGSLVRTKESIGRATRLAMDLLKFGVSAKAMEILAHTLESESNLQRRVDLFFLVDSIAQCSKGLKGETGGVYLSAIQAMLPRLLAAAVPAGATTLENQKQCLKVLRLWLERRILSDSIVRHHIKELESQNLAPACLYSRRSARTERALDDPVRDMEGMLVDEYGTNSTLQLPGFCMPAMLKDEDDGSDSDEGDFEAVTPEHDDPRVADEQEEDEPQQQQQHVPISTMSIDRHTRVLEDVDGELEMEDVAPSWEAGSAPFTDLPETSNGHLGHQHVPPSPPLPSSPPPPPPPPPGPASQLSHCPIPDSFSNGLDCGGYPSIHGDHQTCPPRMNPSMPPNNMHYQGPEPSYSGSCVPPTPNMAQGEDSSFQHRPFPPPPHQYPYMRPSHHMKSRREGPPYSHRSHHMPSLDERNFHDNHERTRAGPYDNRDNWRYPPPSSSYGPRYDDRHKGPYPPGSYRGSPRESGRFHSQRWNYPPRPYNNRHSFHYKPHSEGPVPVGMREQGMWHQR